MQIGWKTNWNSCGGQVPPVVPMLPADGYGLPVLILAFFAGALLLGGGKSKANPGRKGRR